MPAFNTVDAQTMKRNRRLGSWPSQDAESECSKQLERLSVGYQWPLHQIKTQTTFTCFL